MKENPVQSQDFPTAIYRDGSPNEKATILMITVTPKMAKKAKKNGMFYRALAKRKNLSFYTFHFLLVVTTPDQ